MDDDCYEVYRQIKAIIDDAVDCLSDEDFQLMMVTLVSKIMMKRLKK